MSLTLHLQVCLLFTVIRMHFVLDSFLFHRSITRLCREAEGEINAGFSFPVDVISLSLSPVVSVNGNRQNMKSSHVEARMTPAMMMRDEEKKNRV